MQISELQIDALKEIINIGVGRSASSLNKILNKKVSLKVPVIECIKYNEVESRIAAIENEHLSIVKMPFKGELNGLSELVFSYKGAVKIVNILTNEQQTEKSLDNQLKINTLSEIGNMILNALIGSMGNLLKTRIRYSIPKYFECKPNEIMQGVNPTNKEVIYAETMFKLVNDDIAGSFILFLEVESFSNLITLLDNYLDKGIS